MPELESQIAAGEPETLELKRSTAQLTDETRCAFLNAQGGKVVLGVAGDGAIVGQQVSDKTHREIAAMLDRFEPPAAVDDAIVDLPGRSLAPVVLEARLQEEARPFTFGGRPHQRVQTTTSVMPQKRYEAPLLERAHARSALENQPAVDVRLEDLDREEILRTRDAAVRQRRISAGTSPEAGDILDRLGPNYPQGMLEMGRFRGTKITGDILDNRQEHLHAFGIVREAMAWLDRTLPLAAHFPQGQILREDRLPIPPEALREILLNAVMHRDYSDPGSYVAIAVFDDRIEVRSVGRLPRGITAESLSGTHQSVLRNPLIAEAFHRTGAVEIWGRGTNRVIEACERYGVEPPTFEERAGALFVTFRAEIGSGAQATPQAGTKWGPSRDQVQVLEAARVPQPVQALMELCGRSNRTKFRDQVVRPLLEAGLLEMTIPDKPRSSHQRYRTTDAGERLLGEKPR